MSGVVASCSGVNNYQDEQREGTVLCRRPILRVRRASVFEQMFVGSCEL